jgi:hypothetical protein
MRHPLSDVTAATALTLFYTKLELTPNPVATAWKFSYILISRAEQTTYCDTSIRC